MVRSKRALRRHHRERYKRRAASFRGVRPGGSSERVRQIGILARTRKTCGCPECQNPRRNDQGPTRQELRAPRPELLG